MHKPFQVSVWWLLVILATVAILCFAGPLGWPRVGSAALSLLASVAGQRESPPGKPAASAAPAPESGAHHEVGRGHAGGMGGMGGMGGVA